MFFKITTKFSNIDLTDKRIMIYIMQQFVKCIEEWWSNFCHKNLLLHSLYSYLKYIELKEDEISENEISSIY